MMDTAVRRYLRWMRVRHYSPRTVEEREILLGTFLRWCDENGLHDPADVTPEKLETYRVHLHRYRTRHGARLAISSQSLWLISVRGFFRYLVKTRAVVSDPSAALDLPKSGRRIPRHLSLADAEKILELPDVKSPLGLRDRAVLETLYSTGLRRAELASLTLFDVDLSGGLVRVRNGKGDRSRVTPVGERAVKWMEKYLEDSRPYLLKEIREPALFLTVRGAAFTPNRLTGLVRSYVKAAGLPGGSCHLFRHTMATLMHENGADVRHLQEMLGHARLSSTAVYTHAAISHLKEAHRRSHPAERKASP